MDLGYFIIQGATPSPSLKPAGERDKNVKGLLLCTLSVTEALEFKSSESACPGATGCEYATVFTGYACLSITVSWHARSGPGNSGFWENVIPLRRDDLVKFFLKWKSINEKISFKINPAEDGIFDAPIFLELGKNIVPRNPLLISVPPMRDRNSEA